MRDLPRDIDADVVIEIGKLLDDSGTVPLPVHDLVTQIRTLTRSNVSDQTIEQLIVERRTEACQWSSKSRQLRNFG